MKKRLLRDTAFSAVLLTSSLFANAGAVITNGDVADIALGVKDVLNTTHSTDAASTTNAGGSIDMTYDSGEKSPDWRAATAPGCLCEGWGVFGSRFSGYANTSIDGGVNTPTVDAYTSSATTNSGMHGTSFADLAVSQAYSTVVADPDALAGDEASTNTGTETITDPQSVGFMNGDTPAAESEFVPLLEATTTTDLETSHDSGFATANPPAATSPIDPLTLNTDFTDNVPDDHDTFFLLDFADLLARQSIKLRTFHDVAPTEAAAQTASGAVDIELWRQQSGSPDTGTSATFMPGFSSVGRENAPPIPEPSTIMLMTIGLAGLLGIHRRQK